MYSASQVERCTRAIMGIRAYVNRYSADPCFDSGARFARLIIKARDALDSVRVGVIALWVWRATKVTRGKVGTARCSLVETLMAIVL